jgi:hypothetical protein
MTFKPRVLRVTPGRELRWRGKVLFPGLFDGEHYFEIAPHADGARFNHSEEFSGLMVGLMSSSAFENVRRGMEEMNAALKVRAER